MAQQDDIRMYNVALLPAVETEAGFCLNQEAIRLSKHLNRLAPSQYMRAIAKTP